MDWGRYHGLSATCTMALTLGEALAEHYAMSKTPLARGLKVINTERASVPMRFVRLEGLSMPGADVGAVRIYMQREAF